MLQQGECSLCVYHSRLDKSKPLSGLYVTCMNERCGRVRRKFTVLIFRFRAFAITDFELTGTTGPRTETTKRSITAERI
jgi:hypothetical protein